MTRTCHGRLTPHPMVSTAVIHVFVWRVITRITPNVDTQAGKAGCGQRADEALRYQVHVRSPSRERLAVIRLSRWFLRIHHRPALNNTCTVVLTRRLCTGVRQMEGKKKLQHTTTHHAMRASKQGRAGQGTAKHAKEYMIFVQVPKRVRPRNGLGSLASRRRSGRRRTRSFAFGCETWAEIGSRLRPFLAGEISGEKRKININGD
jgi:hypothetical protein